jgi:hypothetical protein
MNEVKGIGDEAPEGWVLEEYEVPMPGGLQEILDTVKSVLQQRKVQSVLLKLGCPITFTRMVKQDEATQRRREEDEGGMKLGDVARNVQMEEYSGSKIHGGPTEILVDMLLGLEARRLHLSYIGVGPETRLFDWLSIDKVAYGGIENLGGAPLVRDKSIPDEVLILFGSPYRAARIDQVTYATKSHMFLPGEDLPEEDKDGQEDTGRTA